MPRFQSSKVSLFLAWLGLTVLLLAAAAPAGAQSPAMARLLGQIDQSLLLPRGRNMQTVLRESLLDAAMLMGLGLRSQSVYVAQDPRLAQEMQLLAMEAGEILGAAALQANFHDPFSKQRVDKNGLIQIMNASMAGEFDAFLLNELKINPQLALAPVWGVPAPGQPPPAGALSAAPSPPVQAMPSGPASRPPATGGQGLIMKPPAAGVLAGTPPPKPPAPAGAQAPAGGARFADLIANNWADGLGFIYNFKKSSGGYAGTVSAPGFVDDINRKASFKYNLNFAGQSGTQLHYRGTLTNLRGTFPTNAVIEPGGKDAPLRMNLGGERLQMKKGLHFREDKSINLLGVRAGQIKNYEGSEGAEALLRAFHDFCRSAAAGMEIQGQRMFQGNKPGQPPGR
jgi:hypothetical protein